MKLQGFILEISFSMKIAQIPLPFCQIDAIGCGTQNRADTETIASQCGLVAANCVTS